jgi:hypothetical protein
MPWLYWELHPRAEAPAVTDLRDHFTDERGSARAQGRHDQPPLGPCRVMVHPNGPKWDGRQQQRGGAPSDLPPHRGQVVHLDPEPRCEMPDPGESRERDQVLLLPLLVGEAR